MQKEKDSKSNTVCRCGKTGPSNNQKPVKKLFLIVVLWEKIYSPEIYVREIHKLEDFQIL